MAANAAPQMDPDASEDIDSGIEQSIEELMKNEAQKRNAVLLGVDQISKIGQQISGDILENFQEKGAANADAEKENATNMARDRQKSRRIPAQRKSTTQQQLKPDSIYSLDGAENTDNENEPQAESDAEQKPKEVQPPQGGTQEPKTEQPAETTTDAEAQKAMEARDKNTLFTTPDGEGGITRADAVDGGTTTAPKKPEEEQQPTEQEQTPEAQRQQQLSAKKKKTQDQKKVKAEQEQQEKQKKEKKRKKAGTIPTVAFILWLSLAAVTDLISLIPYLGLIASWPFTIFFGLYKWIKNLKGKTIALTTSIAFLIEGFFSPLPGNILDVIVTYSASKAKEIENKISKK